MNFKIRCNPGSTDAEVIIVKINEKLNKKFMFCETTDCGNRASEKHHIFSDKKQNRKLYGTLIDHDNNIQFLCYNCHHFKPLKKFTEVEFCEAVEIEPLSKTGQQKKRFPNDK